MKKYLYCLVVLMVTGTILFVSCDEPKITEEDSAEVEVILYANDNEGSSRVVKVYKGHVMEIPRWIPNSRRGYTFYRWCKDKEGTEPFDFEEEKIEAPITLYAAWSRDIILEDCGKISRVTGATLPNETLANPNQTHERWGLGGTDLGIIWEMNNGEYGLLFGDSYGSDFKPGPEGGPAGAGDWRSNVLAYSDDVNLEDGLTFSGMMTDGHNDKRAAPIIERENYYSFTYIPTAAICLDGVQYMHYMYWEVGNPVHADQNYSSIYKSVDNGRTWESCRGLVNFSSTSYFAMGGYAVKEGDPYCYMLGTQSGVGYRNSPAKLARFKYEDILDRSKYEYWNASKRKWMVGKESYASVLLDGTIGELSIFWHEEFQRWITLYFDAQEYAICYRSAANITGPWSEERVLCSGWTAGYSQLYGSYIHPASVQKGSKTLYYTMSLWGPYNVFLMKADVKLAPEK